MKKRLLQKDAVTGKETWAHFDEDGKMIFESSQNVDALLANNRDERNEYRSGSLQGNTQDKGRSGTGAVALRPLRPALPHTMCAHMQERTSTIAYMTASYSAFVVFTCIEHTHNGRAHKHIHMYMHMHARATCTCACVCHNMPCTHTLYIHTPCTHTPCAHMPRIHVPCAHAHVHVPRVRMRRRRPPARLVGRA